MKQKQTLSSGIIIQQDLAEAVRLFFTEWNCDGLQYYSSAGGVTFIVNYKNKPYACTCKHVIEHNGNGDSLFVITNEKRPHAGENKVARSKYIVYPDHPEGLAIGSDILDLALIEFTDDVKPEFFEGIYYISEDTIASSNIKDELLIHGALKEKMNPENSTSFIEAGYCTLEFTDCGDFHPDIVLRTATATFINSSFSSLTGISGSPVYNKTQNKLCGMVIRGGIKTNQATLYYLDIGHILKFLEKTHRQATQA